MVMIRFVNQVFRFKLSVQRFCYAKTRHNGRKGQKKLSISVTALLKQKMLKNETIEISYKIKIKYIISFYLHFPPKEFYHVFKVLFIELKQMKRKTI